MQYTFSTGVDCDMSVGGLGATFKCRVLRALATIDDRFPAMVRIVKAWARSRGLNDSTNGTMNSFALSLLVRCLHFHEIRHAIPVLDLYFCRTADQPYFTSTSARSYTE